MATTKWAYLKEWSFASKVIYFFEKFVPVLEPLKKSWFDVPTTQLIWCNNSWKELIWCTNDPNVYIRIFCKHWSLILRCFFPVSILQYSSTMPQNGDCQSFQCHYLIPSIQFTLQNQFCLPEILIPELIFHFLFCYLVILQYPQVFITIFFYLSYLFITW